jgi:HK97 gp10 family phage protein
MANFYVKVDGLDKLLKRLEAKSATIKEDADAIIEAGTRDIANAAMRDVPKDFGAGGGLLGAIEPMKVADLTHTVTVQKFYAPYVEFGTGANAANYLASQDEDLRAYAMHFYVNGQGRMPARPFLFPNVYRIWPQIIEDLKVLITE